MANTCPPLAQPSGQPRGAPAAEGARYLRLEITRGRNGKSDFGPTARKKSKSRSEMRDAPALFSATRATASPCPGNAGAQTAAGQRVRFTWER